jgi:hypothetical protein
MRTLATKSTEWKGDKNNDDMICKLPQPQPSSIGNPKYNFADIPELAKSADVVQRSVNVCTL